jgi:hypothetical protein
LLAIAVKVTGVPLQIIPVGLADIEIMGATVGVTDTFKGFELAVSIVTQVELDVMWHEIMSPLLRVDAEKVRDAEILPVSVPFILHW